MRLILIGPPGSGKGTQARLLHQRLQLTNVGTGDILREAIRLGTPAGKRAEPFVSTGKLVPDDLVNELVADLFRRDMRPERFVMDGYPRTIAQAHAFDQLLRQQFLDIQAAVLLVVHDDEIVRRLSGRRVCPNCHATYHIAMKPPRVENVCDVCQSALVHRQDDFEETIRRRLEVYHRNTAGLIDHYLKAGLLREVPGEGNVEEIYALVAQSCRSRPQGG